MNDPIVGPLPSLEHIMQNQAVAVTPQIPNNGKWALGLQVCVSTTVTKLITHINLNRSMFLDKLK